MYNTEFRKSSGTHVLARGCSPPRRARRVAQPTWWAVPPTDLRSRSARGAGTAGSLNFFARSRAAPIRAFCSPGCTILRSTRFAASNAARRWITTRSAINWRATPADSLISTRFHHSICTVAVCAHGAARSGAVLVVVDSSRPPLAITGIWALLDQHARGTRWNCARRTWLEREDGWSVLQKAGPFIPKLNCTALRYKRYTVTKQFIAG